MLVRCNRLRCRACAARVGHADGEDSYHCCVKRTTLGSWAGQKNDAVCVHRARIAAIDALVAIIVIAGWVLLWYSRCPFWVCHQGRFVALRLIATAFPVVFEGLVSWVLWRRTIGRRGTNSAQSPPDFEWYLDVLVKHTTEIPPPGCLSRRRIVKMIYFKLWVLDFTKPNPCTHMLPVA